MSAAKGVRHLKTKTVVQVAALELFLTEFVADEMIDALVDLCELARTHPQFGQPGSPGDADYEWADAATDVLMAVFGEDCSPDRPRDLPRVAVNYARGTIELLTRRYRHFQPPPSLAAAVREVPLRLALKPAANN